MKQQEISEQYYVLTEQQTQQSKKTWEQVYSNEPNNVKTWQPEDKELSKITNISITNWPEKLKTLFNLTPLINLRELWLNHNQIVSIDNLKQMYTPHLVKLSFSYNCLYSVRVLRRCYLPSLDQIQLDHNPISDANSLTQMKFNKNHSSLSLWLYFSEKEIEKQRMQKGINAKIYPYYFKK